MIIKQTSLFNIVFCFLYQISFSWLLAKYYILTYNELKMTFECSILSCYKYLIKVKSKNILNWIRTLGNYLKLFEKLWQSHIEKFSFVQKRWLETPNQITIIRSMSDNYILSFWMIGWGLIDCMNAIDQIRFTKGLFWLL